MSSRWRPGVITIGEIRGGFTHNVIPDSVYMQGTARWFRPEIGALLRQRFLHLVPGIAGAFGATAEASMTLYCPATINDPESTKLTVKAAQSVSARVQEMAKPTMGGEDFSFMLNAKAGSYIMLGGGRGTDDPGLHHPKYDFNDDVLATGASYWATLAEQLLPR